MTTTLTQPKRNLKEAKNTYRLPQGEAIRRELVKWFRLQRNAVLEWIKTGKVETKHDSSMVAPRNLDSSGIHLGTRGWSQDRIQTGIQTDGQDRGSIPDLEVKREADPLPDHLPDWNDFQLGNLPMSERMTPKLEAIWDEQGRKFSSKIGLDPDSWEVSNPKTQEAIDKASLEFCTETNKTTTLDLAEALAKTREALSEGLIERGVSVIDLTKRIQKIFTGAETWRARRIAASEASRATHAAQEMQGAESGVVTGWEPLISEDACPLCVLPWTRIWPIGFVGAVKTIYHGPTVLITCSDGSRLAVTPNHLLLTSDGLVPASTLVKGDDVVSCPLFQGHRWTQPNHHHEPSYADEVFRSLAESSHAKRRSMPSGPKHLHGDGAFCQGNIDIVGANRFLSPSMQPGICEHDGEFGFSDPSVGPGFLDSGRNAASTLKALGLAIGVMGGSRDLQAIRLAGVRKAKQLCLAVGSDRDTKADQSVLDGDFIGNKLLGETLDRLSRQVTTCKVIGIDWEHYHGPVYDFETHSSLYVAENGLTSSNCQTIGRRAPAIKLGQAFAVIGSNPTYSTVRTPPFHPLCQCSLAPILDTDPQPQWSATLEQPEPEEQDYAPGEAPEAVIKKPKPARAMKPKPLPQRKPKEEYITSGDLPSESIREFEGMLDRLLPGTLKKLDRAGIKHVLTEKVIDHYPELKGVTPTGWSDELTWEDVGGLFHPGKKEVAISRTIRDSTHKGEYTETSESRRRAAFFHETGHGLDRALGSRPEQGYEFSTSKEWIEAHEKDAGKIDPVSNPSLAYYLQEYGRGRVEVFAELHANYYGESSQRIVIADHFPRCNAASQERLIESR